VPSDDETTAAVERALETIRPALLLDGGGVRLIECVDNRITLSIRGSCRACGSRRATFSYGIVPAIRAALPSVARIEADDLVWHGETVEPAGLGDRPVDAGSREPRMP
jgi:Fe-S cluster biogenesis protein NfuA